MLSPVHSVHARSIVPPHPRLSAADKSLAGTKLRESQARGATDADHAISRRVLVAEDNDDSASTLAELVRIWGHAVRIARDGMQAVEMAVQWRPNVVLLDIVMPKLNGFDAARDLRAVQSFPRPLIIAITGLTQPESQMRSTDVGIDVHLIKPIDGSLLRTLIASGPKDEGGATPP